MQILQLLLNKTVNNYRIWWGFYTPCFDVNYNYQKKTINQKRWRIKTMMNDYGCGKGGLDNSGYKEIRPIYGNK